MVQEKRKREPYKLSQTLLPKKVEPIAPLSNNLFYHYNIKLSNKNFNLLKPS